ncbi:hypothetical protein BTA30_10770 [Bacillus swezeyi]|uniref:Uncharacterized protein n=1 Tax=Bacillus swezeyi TaxID=1925020 RepID=A0A1R1RXY7_9BACI|nr:hypothetical protein BW143_12285 [Bacillus swezeyi]OMI30879.1 hypothetical protein BTA30_10770 [Bacillus swezeyi]
MNYYPIKRQKKEADMGFTTRKNNCKIGTKIILPDYKKRIKNFLRNFDINTFPGKYFMSNLCYTVKNFESEA